MKNMVFRKVLYGISILALIGTIFIFKNLVCFVLTFATLMVFIISYVIKELIKNGIEIKDENDLTI